MQLDQTRMPANETRLLRIGQKEGTYGGEASQLTISLSALRRHVCIVDRTGFGKRGYSKRQLKQMARGPHQLLLFSKTTARLTNPGRKIAEIAEARRNPAPRKVESQ